MKNQRRFAVFLAGIFLVSIFIFAPVQAQSTVVVNLYASTDAVRSGDTIAVQVNFGTFPNLTRYGPIEIQFDPSIVSFQGAEKGSAMPSTFEVNNTVSTSVITVSGLDQTVEGILAANKAAATEPTTESGETTQTPVDPSMYSAESVTVCTVYFKVKESAPTGDARFLIGNVSGFRDSTGAQVIATAGSSATVPVDSMLSSVTSLSELSIEGAIFTQDFAPLIYEYEAHVPRSVTKVDIVATALDLTATITITGEDNLLVGENLAVVRVVAQDGITAVEYKIHIFRDATFVPAGSFITDSAGKIYLFAELPDTLNLPIGFVQESQMIGTQTVPVFVHDGIRSMLLYLKDADKEPALYVYEPNTGVIRPFDANSMLTQPGQLYLVTTVSKDVSIPDGFVAGSVIVGESTLPGYISADTGISILYLTNEAGISRFYAIDSDTGEAYRYFEVKKTTDNFLFPLILVSVFAVAELGMIIYIIYEVRSRNRPKKVRRV